MKPDNLKNGRIIPITHGEVRLKAVDKLPDKADIEKTKKYVLSHSESGHNHVLEADKEFKVATMSSGERYLLIEELTSLVHTREQGQHVTRILSPGIYEVGAKTEYNPFTKTIQRVFD